MATESLQLDINAILAQLPHRYPFLLVDRVIECVPGESIKAIKNVTINEPFFTGHFPKRPVMPGVLIIEAIAQTTGILAYKTRGPLTENEEETLYLFAGIDKARFKRPVEPGDQLLIEAKILKQRKNVWKFSGEVTVDGLTVCTAEVMCAPSN